MFDQKRELIKPPRSLVVVPYAFDPNDMVFSHQFHLINSLTAHFERSEVIVEQVPRNLVGMYPTVTVHLLKVSRYFALRKYISLITITLSILLCKLKRNDCIVFTYMTNVHAAFLAPVLKLLRVRHVLWYAHTSTPFSLRFATIFVDKVITSTKTSIGLSNRKVLAIGQSVDDNIFKVSPFRDYNKKEIWIHVGRIDPSKNIEWLIETFLKYDRLHTLKYLILVGEPTHGNETYLHELMNQFFNPIKSGKIRFVGKKTTQEVSALLQESDCFVHAFQGSLDKSLVEATLSGLPVITCNKSFLQEFGTFVNYEPNASNIEIIDYQIKLFLQSSQAAISRECEYRRNIALTGHTKNRWVERLARELGNA